MRLNPSTRWISSTGKSFVGFALLILLWQYGAPLAGIPDYVLPVPSVVAARFTETFWLQLHHLGVTALTTVVGLAIALVVGVLLALLVIYVEGLKSVILPVLAAFNSIPKIAIAPLFVVWFGFGLTSKIVMAAVISFFPILINVIEGLRSADADRIQMLTVFGASKSQVFRMVRLPSAMPFIFAGLDIGIVFAILGAVVGEFIGAQEGLGYLLLQTNYNFDIAGMFAILVVLSVMGLLAHFVIRLAQHKVAFWAADTKVIGA
jgi:NitT/TauT family transport system permease protein